MQKILSKLPSFSVNTTSKHPAATASVHIHTTLFDETPSPSGSENAEPSRQRPSSSPSSRIVAPIATNVTIKHSSAFNSARESGMSKLEQLQFVAMLKGMILEQASLAIVVATDFRVFTARRNKNFPASPTSFRNTAVYVATLIGGCEGGAAVVVERSEECEYLADAMEDLWEKVLTKVGKEADGLKIGEPVHVGDAAFERAESGETLVASER
ncbi:hypothetical protein BDU57DRAFT_576452 [Ampelomyces quisqualis]|uniref:Uncharacterized protein n=1 Tax=Ampelomyces quisqualis TaxID=50730 RepID=A0A6A5QKB2_AMPQU|nr:hypothetical protein BDU57DRAFT_576452 [Ampelomyces quisqualis]